ncbi:hypothetical protein QYE76_070497 [Lolium multiflorum]|uniref:Retrotransposon gag domain-containing protein n=1 Tax=Lolium multiflorum TaxID=4521 RepID=A0AAD8SKA6_LOLMU|nr:hypothetical protein QYE76_070497 [Lolium multiflorum]
MDACAYLEEPIIMTFGEFRFGVNKEGSYRLEVPISSEFSAVDSNFSSSDEEFSSPRFVDSKASGKLAKIFSNTSFESSADSFISSDSDSVDSFNFIDKSAAIGKVFTTLYDGVTNPNKNQCAKYHQIYAIEGAGRSEPETSEAFDDLGNPYVDPADLRHGLGTKYVGSSPRERVQLPQEAWDRAAKAMDGSEPMTTTATVQELQAYQYRLARVSRELEKQTASLNRRKEAAASSRRRAELSRLSGTSGDSHREARRRAMSRLQNIPEAERGNIIQNLDMSFMSIDERGNIIPKTPEAERDKKEGSVSTHQNLPTKICVGSRVLREEFERLESQKGSSYPKISRNSTACKIPRIGLWIIDMVKLVGGTRATAMQSIQVHLSGAARSWIKKLPPNSIDSWDNFEDIFVKNFRSTCKKPASLEELRACRQKHDESMRKYIQRWNIIKNSAEDISDERAIDAFVAGIRRGDFIEDLGRTNPKTISALMEIANKWADGEDAIYNKRHRSPEEDRGRNYQNRRRFSRQFYNNDAPGHISAGFRGNPGGNSRDDYQRSNEHQGDNRGDSRGNRQNNGPRFQRPYVSPEEMMNGPCQMHFYLDNNGKRQSGHLQKDCRNFQAMLRAAGIANAQATNRNPQGPRSEIHLPPPPAITDENRHQLRIAAAPHPPPYVDPNSNGAVSMIQKARPSNRAQKVISRQVFMAEKMPPPTIEYLNWSGQDIGFTIADHPQQVPRPGQSALILPAVIAGFDVSRVFIDGGSSLNLMYADTLRKMNISLANLKPTDTRFHVITEKPSYPLGKINLDVQFGTRENYRIENLEFEVVDFPSQYHALLGRPAYARFMAVLHYTYLLWRLPGPKGPITIKGSFALSDKCDKDFHRLSETFGMQAEYAAPRLTDYDVLPETNGQVEKANGIICNGIKKRLLGPGKSSAYLAGGVAKCVVEYPNNTKYGDTGNAVFLVHGAEAVLPIEIEHDSPRVTEYNEEISRKALEDDVDALDEARDEVLSRVAKYQQDLKNYHSRRLRPRSFQVGDLVLRLNQKSHEKLESPWLGPYIVTEVIEGGAYRIKDKKTGNVEPNPWNVAQLRRFYA